MQALQVTSSCTNCRPTQASASSPSLSLALNSLTTLTRETLNKQICSLIFLNGSQITRDENCLRAALTPQWPGALPPNSSKDQSVIQEPLTANWQGGAEGLQGSLGFGKYTLLHHRAPHEVSNKSWCHTSHQYHCKTASTEVVQEILYLH